MWIRTPVARRPPAPRRPDHRIPRPSATPRPGLLLPWLALGLAELALALGSFVPPSAQQAALELGGVLVLGAGQVALSRRRAAAGWAGWPAVLVLVAASMRSDLLVPAGLVGLCLALLGVGGLLARLAGRTPPRPAGLVAGTLAALASVGLGRLEILAGADVAAPHQQLARELTRPLQRPPHPPLADAPPLVLLTVDTLRWDHAVQMASWDRLALQGTSWPRAMSTSSWTVPAVASMHTGLSPTRHGAGALGGDRGFSSISTDVPTLAERLRDHGYDTAAVVANPFLATSLGFSRGFRSWYSADEDVPRPLTLLARIDIPDPQEGRYVLARALRFLDGAPAGGWMLWVHFFDPHLPYRHQPPGDLSLQVRHPQQIHSGQIPDSFELRRAVRAAYGREVDAVDGLLGQFLDRLDATGFFSGGGTLVFAADHGEELWDHGGFEHGHSHHGEVVDVPLAVVGPGMARSATGTGTASLADITPTMLAAAGLPAEGLDGYDLHEPLPADRVATATGNLYGDPQHSARHEDRRVILDSDGAGGWTARRFELRGDDKEAHAQSPLPGDPVEAAARAVAESSEVSAERAAAEVNEDALRALGYIE